MSAWDPKTAVIIVDHGSRRAEANDMLHQVAQRYAEDHGVPIAVAAHMELASPTIGEAFAQCVAQGATSIVIAQYFLSPGRHSRSDIPALAAEAAAAHPGVHWSISEPLGVDSRLVAVVHERVCQALTGDANPGMPDAPQASGVFR